MEKRSLQGVYGHLESIFKLASAAEGINQSLT